MTNKKLYFIINKPAGYVCSRNRQNNEKIIYDLLPKELRQKVWSVGRLDKESEGLLILTNDGELTQKLTHPKFEHEKEYGVILDRPLSVKDEKILVKGVVIDGSKTTPVKILNIQGKKLNIILKEGRNRQLRRMFGKMGYRVEQLVRIRVGRLKLSGLRLGCFKKISRDDVL
jgi:pseudouridine synthase